MEKYWACSDETNTIYVWSLDNYEVEFHLRGHRSAVYALCFSTDQSRLATASDDRSARIWDIENETQLVELHHDKSLNQTLFLNGDSQLLTGCQLCIFVWDIETTTKLNTIDINSTYFYSCCYLGSDTILFPRNYRLCCVNLATGELRTFSEDERPDVCALTVSPSEHLFATAAGRKVKIWMREEFTAISELEHPIHSSTWSSISSLRFNPRCDRLAAGCSVAESIVVWDWATQTIVFQVSNVSSCGCINFTSDSTKMICALNATFIVVDVEQMGAIIKTTGNFEIEGCNLQYLPFQVVLM